MCVCACVCVRASTLALVVDLPRGDDLVEHGGEGLVLPADPGGAEWGHDELALANVRFHGDPGSGGGDKVKGHARAGTRAHTRARETEIDTHTDARAHTHAHVKTFCQHWLFCE